jgi:putative addiction module component (TIGR02574 family)
MQPMSIDIATLRGLPVAEKLRLVTQLWDDIARENRPIIVPPDVLNEAKRRSNELAVDPSLAIDEDELWRRVDG